MNKTFNIHPKNLPPVVLVVGVGEEMVWLMCLWYDFGMCFWSTPTTVLACSVFFGPGPSKSVKFSLDDQLPRDRVSAAGYLEVLLVPVSRA